MSEVALHEAIAARILEYVSRPPTGDDPVIRHASPEELSAIFAESVGIDLETAPPHTPDQVLAAAQAVIDWSMHTSHPRFVNQNFAGPDPLAVVGDWMAAALNTTNATYEVAPVFTLMERAVLTRLARIAGFPEPWSEHGFPPGLFTPGGSTATLYALQLALARRFPDRIEHGMSGERPVLFVSETGHYAAKKSAALLGLGLQAAIGVSADATGAMQPGALRTAIAAAMEQGRTPFAVVGTAGTTVTSAFDPLPELADICSEHGLWLHVDGAWGGSALFSDAHRHHLAGVDRADSFAWNLHKLLGMTQQCSTLLLRNPDALGPTFATRADYLFQRDKLHGELDSGDRTFQCGRRVDVLKAWLCWKLHGDAGFAARIDHAVALADHARARIAGSEGVFASVVAGDFTNVCFVWVPPELRDRGLAELSEEERARLHGLPPAIKGRMQAEGTAMIGFQPVNGLNAFRLIFNNPTVTVHDVDRLLELVATYGSAVSR